MNVLFLPVSYEEVLAILEEKYGEKFVFKRLASISLEYEGIRIVVSPETDANCEVFVECVRVDGVLQIKDDYIQIKYADRVKSIARDLLNEVFINSESYVYHVSNFRKLNDYDKEISFEDYATGDNTLIKVDSVVFMNISSVNVEDARLKLEDRIKELKYRISFNVRVYDGMGCKITNDEEFWEYIICNKPQHRMKIKN